MAAALLPEPDDGQVRAWMTEISEIVLLDYLFNQQDRIGNIDYRWEWVAPDGTGGGIGVAAEFADVARSRMAEIPHPPGAGEAYVLRQHAVIGDNDAGGKPEYRNIAKRTGMLAHIRHLRAATYVRLMELARDFEGAGELLTYTRDEFGLSAAQVSNIIKNVVSARDLVRSACVEGRLALDLEPGSQSQAGQLGICAEGTAQP
jgi:hypothetical protein